MIKNQVRFILIILLFNCCKGLNDFNPEVVMFRSYFDFTMEKGKPNYKELFDIQVVHNKNITLFIITTDHSNVKYNLQKDWVMKAGETTYFKTYSYLFIEDGKKFGLKYDSLNIKSGKKFDADSLLSRINIGKQHIAQNSSLSGKLIYTSYNKKVVSF